MISHQALVAEHLAAGTLIAPFADRVTLAQGLRLWAARPMGPGTAVARVAQVLKEAATRV